MSVGFSKNSKRATNLVFSKPPVVPLLESLNLFSYDSIYWKAGYSYDEPTETITTGRYDIIVDEKIYAIYFTFDVKNSLKNLLNNIQKALNGYYFDDEVILNTHRSSYSGAILPLSSILPDGIVAVSMDNLLYIRSTKRIDVKVRQHGGLLNPVYYQTLLTKASFNKIKGKNLNVSNDTVTAYYNDIPILVDDETIPSKSVGGSGLSIATSAEIFTLNTETFKYAE